MYHEFKKYLLHEKTNKPFLYDSLGAQRQTEFTEWLIGMRNGDLVRGDEGEAENKVNIYWVLLVARCWKSFHIWWYLTDSWNLWVSMQTQIFDFQLHKISILHVADCGETVPREDTTPEVSQRRWAPCGLFAFCLAPFQSADLPTHTTAINQKGSNPRESILDSSLYPLVQGPTQLGQIAELDEDTLNQTGVIATTACRYYRPVAEGLFRTHRMIYLLPVIYECARTRPIYKGGNLRI